MKRSQNPSEIDKRLLTSVDCTNKLQCCSSAALVNLRVMVRKLPTKISVPVDVMLLISFDIVNLSASENQP